MDISKFSNVSMQRLISLYICMECKISALSPKLLSVHTEYLVLILMLIRRFIHLDICKESDPELLRVAK